MSKMANYTSRLGERLSRNNLFRHMLETKRKWDAIHNFVKEIKENKKRMQTEQERQAIISRLFLMIYRPGDSEYGGWWG